MKLNLRLLTAFAGLALLATSSALAFGAKGMVWSFLPGGGIEAGLGHSMVLSNEHWPFKVVICAGERSLGGWKGIDELHWTNERVPECERRPGYEQD